MSSKSEMILQYAIANKLPVINLRLHPSKPEIYLPIDTPDRTIKVWHDLGFDIIFIL